MRVCYGPLRSTGIIRREPVIRYKGGSSDATCRCQYCSNLLRTDGTRLGTVFFTTIQPRSILAGLSTTGVILATARSFAAVIYMRTGGLNQRQRHTFCTRRIQINILLQIRPPATVTLPCTHARSLAVQLRVRGCD